MTVQQNSKHLADGLFGSCCAARRLALESDTGQPGGGAGQRDVSFGRRRHEPGAPRRPSSRRISWSEQ